MDRDELVIPKHIAIIMDGNGRWAKKRGKIRLEGHRAGANSLEKILRHAGNIGVKYLTVYAFSTENWKILLEFMMQLKHTLIKLQQSSILLKVLC